MIFNIINQIVYNTLIKLKIEEIGLTRIIINNNLSLKQLVNIFYNKTALIHRFEKQQL